MEFIPPFDDNLSSVLAEVFNERNLQEKLKAEGKFFWTCADNKFEALGSVFSVPNTHKLSVLGEEVGEVADVFESLRLSRIVKQFGVASHHVNEMLTAEARGKNTAELQKMLRTELVQVAAVAVAWVEALNKQGVR